MQRSVSKINVAHRFPYNQPINQLIRFESNLPLLDFIDVEKKNKKKKERKKTDVVFLLLIAT